LEPPYTERYVRWCGRSVGELITYLLPDSLIEEIKCAENYLAIQKIRYEDYFIYTIELQKGLENTKIIPLMILSFIENSIKYAFMDEKELHINICIKQLSIGSELSLYIEITDNGPGFPDEIIQIFKHDQDSEVTGIGIRNIRRRLSLVYGNDARIILTNEAGARVVIIIPLIFESAYLSERNAI